MKILILKRDKLGDLLLTTPVFRLLRNALPQAEIHLLAPNYNAWVAKDNAALNTHWVYGRVRTGKQVNVGAALGQLKLFYDLKRQHFDVAIAAGGEHSPRAISRLLHVGAPRNIAYADSAQARLPKRLTDPQTVPLWSVHETRRLANLLLPLGIAVPAQLPNPEFTPPQNATAFAQQWMAAEGLKSGGFVVLGLGSRRRKRQPSAAQILRWAAWLKRTHQLDSVLLWTPGKTDDPLYPGDDDVAQPILDAKVSYIHAFRGALINVIAVVYEAATSVFPDSGLMHFAAASPGGVLGLFADTVKSPSPERWGPVGQWVDYIEAKTTIADVEDVVIEQRLGQLLDKSKAHSRPLLKLAV
jgi:heptosyltransferase III